MTDDLEATRLCAEALGYPDDSRARIQGDQTLPAYNPLEDKAQCFELIERFCGAVVLTQAGGWSVSREDSNAYDTDLRRAVVYCVAAMQKGE